jgi:hypothetical protein
LARLIEMEFEPEGDSRRAERAEAERHAESCEACGARLRDQRSAQVRLGNMVASLTPERKPDCPPEKQWMLLVAGLRPPTDATMLLQHAMNCDFCGRLLKSAAKDFSPEISAEEQRTIRELASAGSVWQSNLAQEMARMSSASARETPAVRSQRTASFARWMRWVVPLGAAAALAVGAKVYLERSQPSLISTNQLIARAFSEQRPIDLRFPGASYAPARQERGVSAPSRSRLDEPAELLEAETQIQRGLAKHPDDPGWLQAKARANLFEGNYQEAIEELRRAEGARQDDLSLKVDLATAYYERA